MQDKQDVAKANGVDYMVSHDEKPMFDMKVNVTLSAGNST